MTRLLLVGYGKMGRLVEQLAPAHGFEVVARLSSAASLAGPGAPVASGTHGAEVAIDFSTGGAVADTVERLAPLGIAMVIGTTGWQEQLPRVREAVLTHGAGLVHGANFSLGVQVFYRVVETAARLLAADLGHLGVGGYGAWAYEIHHCEKRDAPSGTLKEMLRRMEGAGYQRPVDVASNRAGRIPGTHLVGFDSEADTIRLEHQARSRAGFADGALRAARWVLGRRGMHAWSDVWEEALVSGKET